VLFILDGHSTHKSFDTIDLATRSRVIKLTNHRCFTWEYSDLSKNTWPVKGYGREITMETIRKYDLTLTVNDAFPIVVTSVSK
jgi:hypothetical protein